MIMFNLKFYFFNISAVFFLNLFDYIEFDITQICVDKLHGLDNSCDTRYYKYFVLLGIGVY